ncbi:MAG TPA: transglycosylase SLT domain-containing protein [Acidimicrobiales bacterium]|nr:transglycosylase SLT domain-containing protein [Acidimicrobiales bacterium]
MPSAVDAVRAEVARINALGNALSQVSPASAGAFAAMLSSAQGNAGAGGSLAAGDLTAAGPGGEPGAGSASGGPTGDQVVTTAEHYLGVPYKWGGTDPSTGLDCSGLVQVVFGQLGVSLPRTSQEQQQVGQPVASVAEAQPGDLIFYGSPAEHVGIYVGNGQMIDAPHTGTSVRIEGVGTPTSIRRVTAPSASPTWIDTASFGSSSPVTGAGSGADSVAGAGGGLGPVPPGLASLFLSSAAKYGLSPTLLAAVAKVESGFDPNAVSPAGAVGLMQLMPSTAAGMGVDPTNPAQAVDGAARILSQNIAQFGSVPLAVAAYNAGAGAVTRYGGVPPYPETQQYVSRVMALAGGAQ